MIYIFYFNQIVPDFTLLMIIMILLQGRIQRGGPGIRTPPWNFGKKVVIRFVIGTGLILHSIYVNYSHKSKKGSKCGDLMVRT